MVVSGLLLATPASASEYLGILDTGLGSNGMGGVAIAPPFATPVVGAYTAAQNVVLSAPGSQSIRYTTNGTAPSCENGLVYGAPIAVTSTQTIKAVACYANNNASAVASLAYVITASANNSATGNNNSSGSSNVSSGGGGGGGGWIMPISKKKKGDADGDNKIDLKDFNYLMVNWMKTGSSVLGDFDDDKKVDLKDFNELMINWGK